MFWSSVYLVFTRGHDRKNKKTSLSAAPSSVVAVDERFEVLGRVPCQILMCCNFFPLVCIN
jgi:hypothetical protein